jgi:phage baseplate assembly protein W
MSFDLLIQNGDLQLQNGDLQQVTDTDKLVQDVLKICLTTAGADPMNPWYGSYISRSLVGSTLDTSITVQLAQSQLQNAIENLKNLQAAQIKSFQQVSPAEQIAAITNISITRSTIDPRVFIVNVKVLSKALTPVQTSFNITL